MNLGRSKHMPLQIRKLIVLAPLMALLLTGCPKSPREYVAFAKAGVTYGAAMDNLLVATQSVVIDSDSEQLAADKVFANSTGHVMTEAQYRNISDKDQQLLKIIAQLREHTHLMSKYFEALYELGTSDAPARAQNAIGDGKSGLIANLNKVGDQIRGSGIVTGGAAAAAGPIANAVVNGLIRKALKDEITARGPTIRRELALQQELFDVLSKRIKQSASDIQQARERRLIIEPYIAASPLPKTDDWITARRTVLTLTLVADQLSGAGDAVKKLNEAFDDLMSNKLSIDRFNDALADFETLLTITEKLRG